ncbi:sodium/hydrogen exchanger [Desulfarculus baarsii DSM 2075]|uniref:Sodium/hydrogen exchanger n=1 Tax=Desulfarculus baarsii (strain ATCC 33931 / DSM 2075 / LMG 7858 / VKM B-1802 / 2st14) TaxID=644282 RepID=E1QD83_DESB2|nr:cation:proton antiporter [Desulfarculus baarsii]ADK83402.1 sodium/hydrogen exchanger [Desulfarculus baarsii DSM 2075]
MGILLDLVVILGLSLGVIYVFHRLGIPNIVGFLIAGALAGPHGLGLVSGVHEVELMAEVGVVLLLFTIGLEFSIKDLMQIKDVVFIGGALQVLGAMALGAGAAHLLGLNWNTEIFVGFLLALSSTAIVLNLLRERSALDTPAGRICLAILIFQDIAVVPMMLAVPFLAGGHVNGADMWLMLQKGLAAVAALLVLGRWLAPWAMARVADTRSREMFLISVVTMCLGVAALTWWAGLSLALGAFAAGLIISSSPFGLQAVGSILPMRDLFISIFFISMGMLVEPAYFVHHPVLVLTVTALVLILKQASAGVAVLFLGHGLRVAGSTALSIGQIGEFSFVLAQIGLNAKLLDSNGYNLFLATAIMTMVLTPFMLSLGFRLGEKSPAWLSAIGLGGYWSPSWGGPDRQGGDDEGHAAHDGHAAQVVVIGYGLAGRNVVRAARLAGLPFLVVEMNPHTVRQQSALGLPIVFGDASNPAVLAHAGLAHAKILVVSMGGSVVARRIVAAAKSINPTLHVIVRTRYESEVEGLRKVGADEVIPEEYETALEIFTRVLRRLRAPESEIATLLAQLRRQDYNSLRDVNPGGEGGEQRLSGLFDDTEILTFRLDERSPLVGRSLGQANLRKDHGVTVVAIKRPDGVAASPGADELLAGGDMLVVMGPPGKVAAMGRLFGAPPS